MTLFDVCGAGAILDEANIAFELNTGLFTALRPPTNPRTPEFPLPAVLGDPSSPTLSSFSSATPSPSPSPPVTPLPLQSFPTTKEPLDSAVTSSSPGTFPLASVVAFILALCLSHFVLTLGGFTGDKGYAKLEAVFQWILTPFVPASSSS